MGDGRCVDSGVGWRWCQRYLCNAAVAFRSYAHDAESRLFCKLVGWGWHGKCIRCIALHSVTLGLELTPSTYFRALDYRERILHEAYVAVSC